METAQTIEVPFIAAQSQPKNRYESGKVRFNRFALILSRNDCLRPDQHLPSAMLIHNPHPHSTPSTVSQTGAQTLFPRQSLSDQRLQPAPPTATPKPSRAITMGRWDPRAVH